MKSILKTTCAEIEPWNLSRSCYFSQVSQALKKNYCLTSLTIFKKILNIISVHLSEISGMKFIPNQSALFRAIPESDSELNRVKPIDTKANCQSESSRSQFRIYPNKSEISIWTNPVNLGFIRTHRIECLDWFGLVGFIRIKSLDWF